MKPLDPARVSLFGTTLIEASAGTGKTYTITTLVLRLLVESELSIDHILVVTYTRAATAELRDRIRARIKTALDCARGEHVEDEFVRELCAAMHQNGRGAWLKSTLERALHDIDQAPVLTIHGFCQRALSDHAFESDSGLDVKLTAHAAPLLEEIADDYYVRELSAASQERVRALDRDEPKKLRALSVRASHEHELLPREISDVRPDRTRWDEVFTRARGLFGEDREHIERFARLAIKGQGHHVPKWINKVADFFEDGKPGFSKEKSWVAPLRHLTNLAHRDDAHPFFSALRDIKDEDERYLEACHATRVAFRKNFVHYVERELRARTQREGVRTFDALLEDLDLALHGPKRELLLERLRSDYRAALVDEFQDTDPVQYRIFRRIFAEHAPLFLIGDPKQAIYGFRGADVFAYMEARKHVGERVFTLDVNRRSDTALVSALNTLYASVSQPFALPGIDYISVSTPKSAEGRFHPRDGGAPLEVLVVPTESSSEALRRRIAEQVASEIVTLLEGPCERLADEAGGEARFRRLRPADVAVLCRTNREALLVQEALRERNVPNVFQGDESVFQSLDAVEIERLLRALAHPGDARALRSFLSSMYGGYDALELARLEGDDRAWDEHRATLTELHDVWLEHGFIQAFRGLIVTYDVERKLLARPDGPRRVTNLWHLSELLAEAALDQHLGPLALLRWLMLVRSDDAIRSELVGDAHELRLESASDAVRLTTVHKSKGLEYPIVFVPFAWDPKLLRGDDEKFLRFHDDEGRPLLDLAASEQKHKERATEEALAEALRLLYVALTRGKHRVYVVAPSVKDFEKSALGYTLFGGRASEGSTPKTSPTEPALLAHMLTERLGSELIRVRRADAPATTPLTTRSSSVALAVRSVKRRFDTEHRTSSFSALVSGAPSTPVELGHDHDNVDTDAPPEKSSSLVLDAFPRGAGPGQLVHEILELCDFASDQAALSAVVQRVLKARGYASELEPMLTLGLTRVLETPLADGFALNQVARERRLDELEFLLPVNAALTPRRLEQAFRAHKAPESDPSYAARLRTLGFDAMRGFLRGFIDLVFEHEGRFYVVDYKSNHLGSSPSDYAAARLCEAMADHHYYLQAHLYAVAVHRYLAQRLVGYDYDQHFGGVYYLFLRGMDPTHEPRTGVFFERPQRALIDDLDRTLRGEERAS